MKIMKIRRCDDMEDIQDPVVLIATPPGFICLAVTSCWSQAQEKEEGKITFEPHSLKTKRDKLQLDQSYKLA